MNRLVFRLGLAILVGSGAAQSDDAADWFERRVRPVLGTECWSCHGPQLQQGGLRLDSLESMLEGGGRGPAVVPGDPSASVLLRALRQEGPQMPPGGPLPAETVADIAKWIKDGAVWPSSGEEIASLAGQDRSADRHWAFQAVRRVSPPNVRDGAWPRNEVDRFVLAKLEGLGWKPAAQASRRTLIRRASFDLTGLPPRPEAVEAFVRNESPTAYEDLVETLLESDQFGEHWARHWMDWVRYCESHGSQGDFELPMAWRYRDYLIRAFNSDVPYDQMVREYFAGDLLENPRIDAESGLNESMHGPGNLRMVEYGYVPVDALDDQLKVVENQIEVFSKAFQGLTVSCARCHDHKFDPVTQQDFFALYGVFASSRPGLVTVDSPELLNAGRDRLEELRGQVRAELAAAWKTAEVSALLRDAGDRLDRDAETDEEESPDDTSDRRLDALTDLLEGLEPDAEHVLKPWLDLRDLEGTEFRDGWDGVRSKWLEVAAERRASRHSNFRRAWDLRQADDYKQWFPYGPGMPSGPSEHGEFRVLTEGDRILAGVLPGGVHTGLDSQKYGGILGSPRFRIESDYISLRVQGTNFPYAKVIVENYPIGDGGIHPATDLESDAPHWIRFDTTYRKGQNAYLELQALDDRSRKFRFRAREPDREAVDDGRSSFGILEVVFHDSEDLPEDEPLALLHLIEGSSPAGLEALEERYDRLVQEAAADWQDGTLDSRQTAFLDELVRSGVLPVTLDEVPRTRALVEEYRGAESDVPTPRRAPGVLPGTSFDQPLFRQGDHTKPGDPVERRYLEFLGGRPFRERGSGRLALAQAIASPENPLTARVLVNRLWHYLFGHGLVATVDNFGTMGGRPSHPELLDFLADQFVAGGWSIQGMIRFLVQSRAYQMSTVASSEAMAEDPGNRYLQHQTARRLPAESIRDAILETSGDLDPTMYGPSINVYYVGKTEGGGGGGRAPARRRKKAQRLPGYPAQRPESVSEAFRLAGAVHDSRQEGYDQYPGPVARDAERPVRCEPGRAMGESHAGRRSRVTHGSGRADVPPGHRPRPGSGRNQAADFVSRRTGPNSRSSRDGMDGRSGSVEGSCPDAVQSQGVPVPPLAAMTACPSDTKRLSRRQMLARCSTGFGSLALSSILSPAQSEQALNGGRPDFPPRAMNVIFCFMSGGVSHVDSFDPKPRLKSEAGKPMPVEVRPTMFDDVGGIMPSPWEFARYGQSGIWVSELFPHMASCADDLCVIRSMTSKANEHAQANYFIHTGHPFLGHPSAGSWTTYGLGTESENLPGFVVLASGGIPLGGVGIYGNGFLPAMHQASFLYPEEEEPLNNIRPADPDALQRTKIDLIRALDGHFVAGAGQDPAIEAAIRNYETAYLMQSAVPDLLDLSGETPATKALYGMDSSNPETAAYGRECLLARRLVERGVRFVELTCLMRPSNPGQVGNPWDQHGELREGHTDMAMQVDQPIAGLLKDLKARGMLDQTLVIWAGEFGRTPFAQGDDGRDHNPFGFSIWLAGGGVKPGFVYGATDEYGYYATETPMNVYDLWATVLHLLGVNHETLTYRFGGRDVRLSDVFGRVVGEICA